MIRPFIFGCLTALIATLIAHKSSAAFMEAPYRPHIQLEWSDDAGSIQALLYSSLQQLSEKDPAAFGDSSPLNRNGSTFRLEDETHHFVCEAATLGRLAVESYRCDLLLASPEFSSEGNDRSVASVLFDGMQALHAAYGGSLPIISVRETANTRLIRMVDASTSSRVACERTLATEEVRCRVDIRP